MQADCQRRCSVGIDPGCGGATDLHAPVDPRAPAGLVNGRAGGPERLVQRRRALALRRKRVSATQHELCVEVEPRDPGRAVRGYRFSAQHKLVSDREENVDRRVGRLRPALEPPDQELIHGGRRDRCVERPCDLTDSGDHDPVRGSRNGGPDRCATCGDHVGGFGGRGDLTRRGVEPGTRAIARRLQCRETNKRVALPRGADDCADEFLRGE